MEENNETVNNQENDSIESVKKIIDKSDLEVIANIAAKKEELEAKRDELTSKLQDLEKLAMETRVANLECQVATLEHQLVLHKVYIKYGLKAGDQFNNKTGEIIPASE